VNLLRRIRTAPVHSHLEFECRFFSWAAHWLETRRNREREELMAFPSSGQMSALCRRRIEELQK